MKKFVSVIAILLLFIGSSIAQVLSPVVTSSKNLDPVKLAQIDTLLNEYVKNNWLVGASTIIVKDNQVYIIKVMVLQIGLQKNQWTQILFLES